MGVKVNSGIWITPLGGAGEAGLFPVSSTPARGLHTPVCCFSSQQASESVCE